MPAPHTRRNPLRPIESATETQLMTCAHGHHHHHPHHLADGKMGWAVLITAAFVLGEGVAGFLGHSVALLSDAGHNLADALALLFSWYALRVASRPSNST